MSVTQQHVLVDLGLVVQEDQNIETSQTYYFQKQMHYKFSLKLE